MTESRNNIDVVIPVRDLDKYLDESINSALDQSGVTCNIIVIDAGSQKPIKLNKFHSKKSNVHLYRSNLPLTAGGARNFGLKITTAPYISFLDADDVWPTNRSHELIDVLSNSEFQMALGVVENFKTGTSNLEVLAKSQVSYLAGGILFKSQLLKRIGYFDESLKSGEFIDWFKRLEILGIEYAKIDACTLRRRIHLESTTAQQINDRSDYLRVVRNWMNQKN